MVGCGDDSKKNSREDTKKERRHKPITSKKSKEKGYSEKTEEITDDDDSRSLVQSLLLSEKKNLPIDTGVGIVVTDIYLDDNFVVYDAMCDEEKIPIDVLIANKDAAKEGVLNMLKDGSDPNVTTLVNMCKESHIGIIYNYIGDTSGKTCPVVITPSDM